jgi:hypothetical protein
MEVYIHRSLIPTDYHIHVLKDLTDGKIKLKKTYSLLNPAYGTEEFEELAQIYHKPLPDCFPPKPFKTIYETILGGSSLDLVHWSECLPEKVLSQSVRLLATKLFESFSDLDLSYWNNHYVKNGFVFSQLFPAKINEEYYEGIPDKKQILLSFMPDRDGFCQVPEYSRKDSVTGRTTVVSGPQIILLKKEHRKNMFVSRFGSDGEILILDFKALEPQTLMNIFNLIEDPEKLAEPTNHSEDYDLYEDILTKLKSQKPYTRDLTKEVSLAELYGSGFENLKDKIDFQEYLSVSKQIQELFHLKELENWIDSKATDGFIYNFFGKPIPNTELPSHKKINYLAQSTAVEVALNGFSILCKKMEKMIREQTCLPLFVLHDALIIDTKKNLIDELKKLVHSVETEIDGFNNLRFSIKIKTLSGEKI